MWLHCIILYARTCPRQAHTVQYMYSESNRCGQAQSFMIIEPECSNDFKGSELCIIVFRHLSGSTRALNNTELRSVIVQSADMHVSASYTSSVQLSTHLHMLVGVQYFVDCDILWCLKLQISYQEHYKNAGFKNIGN